jgi:release factor glutamine methyltransferase
LTLLEAINSAAAELSAAGIADARRDAEALLYTAADKDRAWLLAHIREELDDNPRTVFQQFIERRARREPLQYITGVQEFWGLEFLVNPAVLIPRPETELIVETVLSRTLNRTEQIRIVDLCTGSGCIAVSLAKELSNARIFALDASAAALDTARANARRHSVADRIRFLEGDLFLPLEELDLQGQVDIIVSNPPYVTAGERPSLQPEVRDYEPGEALFAGPRGTEFHERILAGVPRYLKKSGGMLIMEMGIGQAEKLADLIRQHNHYGSLEVLKDLAGIERVIVMQKK